MANVETLGRNAPDKVKNKDYYGEKLMEHQSEKKSDFGRAIQWGFGFIAAQGIVVAVIIVAIILTVLACCGCLIGAGFLGILGGVGQV